MYNSYERDEIMTIMSANEYQNFCESIRLESANDTYTVLNLSGEVGELHSLLAKARRDGRKFDYEQNIKKELGDIMWSVAIIALDNGWALQDVIDGNVSKLSKRKVEGTLQGSGDDR
jgi:NTP pyrophosphatase (non-canonical NTP hydrolase)